MPTNWETDVDAAVDAGILALAKMPLPKASVGDLEPWRHSYHNGSKWAGGFGPTELLTADYWTLRMRSAQLFRKNLYARGLIRRLVTNVINTGLHLEATPEELLLGLKENDLVEWSEDIENRFTLWGNDATLCDQSEQRTFGDQQATAYREAILEGDVLATLVQDRTLKTPRVRLISGSAVQSPPQLPAAGNRIDHGVERDASGKHVAYWVRQDDGTIKRMPAWGEKSRRRIAWLIYGCDKRLDEVRGEPILSLVLQSLNEIDRYRDSVQRKAVINSIIAMFVKKTTDKPGSSLISGGSLKRGIDQAPDAKGEQRSFKIAESLPGMVLEELQQGEEPVGFQPHGTDEKFGDFESAIIQAIAWAHEIPPEILTLSFTKNYSASQAAINEFKLFLNPERARFGKQFCQPIYEDWLLSEVIANRVQAAGLFEAWITPASFTTLGAWNSATWCGHIKPAVDLSKLIAAYAEAIKEGFISRDRAARELFGTKFTKNVKKLFTENALLVNANRVLLELEPKTQPAAPSSPRSTDGDDDEGSDDDEAAARTGELVAMRRAS